ncbi:hypothetical protein CY35_20G019900 [Sphagnum magellanicum]|nr:hypothetical protein CY35_20G019900 [Sphagnum magellanicum]
MGFLGTSWFRCRGPQIVVEGCAHGDLDNIYATLQYLESVHNIKIELLICCRDFQAAINKDDESLPCSSKCCAMIIFWKCTQEQRRHHFPLSLLEGIMKHPTNYGNCMQPHAITTSIQHTFDSLCV